MGSVETIPTVDISAWLDPSSTEEDRQNVVDAMRQARTTYGFLNLVGYGVSLEEQKQAMDCAKLFFTLSEEEKMDVWIGKCKGRSFRGYEPPGIQVHQEGLLPDTKARYLGESVADVTPGGPVPDPNYAILGSHGAAGESAAQVSARALPSEWNCAPDALDALAENEPSIPMRLLRYAPQPTRDERQFGVGDHTDFGFITILLQEMGLKTLGTAPAEWYCW
ncbi:uncharacterized protein BDW70DRAFT_165110 [Aspergillus foveolatus]|uniref:uncharacterized protein n=1 Tax=Aspergillus foveolatus TaxID=210207 RepID=UPI003CCD9A1A